MFIYSVHILFVSLCENHSLLHVCTMSCTSTHFYSHGMAAEVVKADLQWLPESVRYLVAMGDSDKALATLKRVADENGKPMPLGRLVEPVQQEVCCKTGNGYAGAIV